MRLAAGLGGFGRAVAGLVIGRSLARRLIASAALWSVALLILGAGAVAGIYRNTAYGIVQDRIEGAIDTLLESVFADESGVLGVTEPEPLDPRFSQTYAGRYWQVFHIDERDGRLTSIGASRSLFGSTLDAEDDLVERAREKVGERVSGSGAGPEGQRLLVRAIAIRVGPFDDLVLIASAADRADADRRVRNFALASALTLAPFALGLLAIVFIQVRWGLSPLYKMRDAVTAVREGERERLDEDAPTELAPLAHELNALIDHNRDLVERARAHVGNLAHALKTPVSVILNESRAQQGDFAELVRRQTEKMQVQVEHHIKRAQAAARAQSLGSRADVKSVIDDLARTLPRMYPERPVLLEAEPAEDLVFRGERQDLEEMIGNLLDNAYKWTRGRVRVVSRPAEAPGPLPGQIANQLVVEVDDDGPGLAPEQRTEVIARGIRLDEATPGSGLGLAIVHDLARAYGGKLELGASPWGGLRGTLTLPSAAARRAGR